MSRLPLNTLTAFRAVGELQNLRAAASRAASHAQRGQPADPRAGRAAGLRAFRATWTTRGAEPCRRSPAAQRAGRAGSARRWCAGGGRAAASGTAQRIRMTVLPSFAQRWLLPRMGRWRERHPDLALEIDASPQLVDLQREGFHAGLRQGRGPWAGLESERLFDAPMPIDRGRLAGRGTTPARCRDPRRLHASRCWTTPNCGNAGSRRPGFETRVTTVAVFNDAGLMLQAAEQNLGSGALPRAACSRRVARWTAGQAVTGVDHLRASAPVPSRVSAGPARLAAARRAAGVAA